MTHLFPPAGGCVREWGTDLSFPEEELQVPPTQDAVVLDVAGQVHGAGAVHGAVHLHVAVDCVQVLLLVLLEDRRWRLNEDLLEYEYAVVSRVNFSSRYLCDHLATLTSWAINRHSRTATQRQASDAVALIRSALLKKINQIKLPIFFVIS